MDGCMDSTAKMNLVIMNGWMDFGFIPWMDGWISTDGWMDFYPSLFSALLL